MDPTPTSSARYFTRGSRAERTANTAETPTRVEDDPPSDHGPPWDQPIRFPAAGKNAAVVEYSDLSRLDPGEYLNDSIIWFYMRWLEEKHTPRPNQVYFFNTHFYSALTGATKSRISHKAVERWTRNVDLFTYDFLVVPVHENSHWYVAIVCNLPNLARILEEDELVEIDKPEPAIEPRSAALSTQVFGILKGQSSVDEDDERPRLEKKHSDLEMHDPIYSDELQQDLSPARVHEGGVFQHSRVHSPVGRKKRRPAPRKKFNTNEPIIVILDSLHTPHQQTIQNLKDYLIAEAMSKRSMEITRDSIKGANLKHGIPAQDNFSDCGVYVCGYIDKFMRNPKEFGRKMLAQEFDEVADWPEMNPSTMRRGIKDVLLHIAKEQQEERVKEKQKKKAAKRAAASASRSPAVSKGPPASNRSPPPASRGPPAAPNRPSSNASSPTASYVRTPIPPVTGMRRNLPTKLEIVSGPRQKEPEKTPSPDYERQSRVERPPPTAARMEMDAHTGAWGVYRPAEDQRSQTPSAGILDRGRGDGDGYCSSVDLVDP
jgi:hypothetical protein